MKQQHAAEVAAFKANFDELAAELARQRAINTLPVPKVGGLSQGVVQTGGVGGAVSAGTGAAEKVAPKKVGGGGGGLQKRKENVGQLRA